MTASSMYINRLPGLYTSSSKRKAPSGTLGKSMPIDEEQDTEKKKKKRLISTFSTLNRINEIKRKKREQKKVRESNFVKFARYRGAAQETNRQKSTLRDLMRRGVNTNSTKFTGRSKDWELAQAAARAGAGSNAAANMNLYRYENTPEGKIGGVVTT